MITKYFSKLKEYTGQELRSLFAYQTYGVQGDSLVAFSGPCYVSLEDLVDQEDVKAKAYIKSESMVHFIGEFFNLDLPAGVLRQRLYISIIKEVIEEVLKALRPGDNIERKGDDIFINDRKLSVSIATLSPVSTLIHIGINISSKNTPIKTIGLADLKIAPQKFAEAVLKRIADEETDMTLARCKVRGVK